MELHIEVKLLNTSLFELTLRIISTAIAVEKKIRYHIHNCFKSLQKDYYGKVYFQTKS